MSSQTRNSDLDATNPLKFQNIISQPSHQPYSIRAEMIPKMKDLDESGMEGLWVERTWSSLRE